MKKVQLNIEDVVNLLQSVSNSPPRYERKSRFRRGQDAFIVPILKAYGFISEYPDRFINSIYFDTYDLDFAKANINGDRFRFKPRIRWYNSSKKRQLEFKFRDGFNGYKLNYNLPSDVGGAIYSANKKIKKETGLSLNPVVKVSYHRSYYIHSNGIRLTVDTGINAHRVDSDEYSNIVNLDFEVVEFKYESQLDDQFRYIYNSMVDYIPLRLTKCSKYVESMLTTQDV